MDRPLVCPIMVGRQADLAEVERLIAAAGAGRGGGLVLGGEAGLGKSRLVGEARARADARGIALLEA
ncbi:MAG TPA: AAA family ATPase, partial [Chloroflexota bacterium]